MTKLPSLNNRLLKIIQHSTNGNVSEFAKIIGVSQPRLNRLFAEDTRTNKIPSVPSEVIIAINEMFINIDPDWLLTGKGEMFRSQNLDKAKQLFNDSYKTKSSELVPKENGNKKGNNIDSTLKVQKTLPNETNIEHSPQGKVLKRKNIKNELVPFYDVDFAAGNNLSMIDDTTIAPSYFMDIPDFSGCTAFRAYSDSMEKLIKSGSILFGTKIETWLEHLEYGQIYGIICVDGRRYLKYIRRATKYSEYFLLRSENNDYDDFDLPKSAIRSIWLIHGWLNRRT